MAEPKVNEVFHNNVVPCDVFRTISACTTADIASVSNVAMLNGFETDGDKEAKLVELEDDTPAVIQGLSKDSKLCGMSVRKYHLGYRRDKSRVLKLRDWDQQKISQSSDHEKGFIISIGVDQGGNIPKNLSDVLKSSNSIRKNMKLIRKDNTTQVNKYFCFLLEKGTKLPDPLHLFEDNYPDNGHCSIAPFGSDLRVTVHDAKNHTYAMCSGLAPLWKLHCFSILAAATPVSLRDDKFSRDTWDAAHVMFRNFNELDMPHALSVLAALDVMRENQYKNIAHALAQVHDSLGYWVGAMNTWIGNVQFDEAVHLIETRDVIERAWRNQATSTPPQKTMTYAMATAKPAAH
eukprot:m.403534 g.403534  ORF g.403534 m.403534 type:complete len:348 (-) comp21193_c1_seq9:896-1939(-)